MTTQPPERSENATGELLPCPFCGSGPLHACEEDVWHLVRCTNRKCGAQSGIFPTKPWAFRMWNTRIPAQKARDPEVVAAVQEAIMRHPFWKPGLGSSGFAFGLANTAIEAYTSALPSTESGSEK